MYQLIGGKCREKVRAYGGGATPDWVTCGQPGSRYSADDLIPMLQEWDAEEWAASLPAWSPEPHCPVWGGFTCHKVCYLPATMIGGMPQPIVIQACVDAFAALRKKVGNSVDLAMDLHGRASPAIARALVAKLAPYDPMFIEEPILGDDLESLLSLQNLSTVPIATGERLYTRWQFQDIIAKSAVQIVQPDIITSGECDKRVSAMLHSTRLVRLCVLIAAGWVVRCYAQQVGSGSFGRSLRRPSRARSASLRTPRASPRHYALA